ncbi:MAG: hypothetical protein HKL82_07585 [Acidimicrobiaceae bacterium]|nr:hypothetical protein [Acidimicrobiaceae bacterium]
MGKWLSQEWIDDTKALGGDMPVRPGLGAKINYLVTDGPEGDAQYFWVVEDGRLSDAGLGELEGAELQMTMTYEDARSIQTGSLDANTAFMQGKLKVTGSDMSKLLQLLPITSSPEYRTLETKLAELTEF